MKNIKVLHLFNTYLPDTENWAYSLINNTPNTEIHIASLEVMENSFDNTRFHFANNYSSRLRTKIRTEKDKISKLSHLVLRIKLKLTQNDNIEILKYIEDNDIDIVHAHFADVAWSFKECLFKKKRPIVVSFYGWDYEHLPFLYPEYNKHFQEIFTLADAIICEGNHGKKILENKGCERSKIKVIKLGIKSNPISKEVKTKQPKQLNLLQLSTFTEKKGQIYTLLAFIESLKTCSNMHLTFIGGGKQKIKDEILKIIIKNRLESKVTIKDFIPFNELNSHLKEFDVFIHPSCYSDERDCEGGAPVVLLNAQFNGLPIISTVHCDIPDEVIHGKTGFLAAEKNVSQISEFITKFYKMSEEEFETMSRQAREHVSKEYDSNKNAIALGSLYETLSNS